MMSQLIWFEVWNVFVANLSINKYTSKYRQFSSNLNHSVGLTVTIAHPGFNPWTFVCLCIKLKHYNIKREEIKVGLENAFKCICCVFLGKIMQIGFIFLHTWLLLKFLINLSAECCHKDIFVNTKKPTTNTAVIWIKDLLVFIL